MYSFEEKVLATIKKYNMLSENETAAAAVSGGADSMAMLCALISLGFNVCAVHINHMLRGADADSDMLFVKNFCEKNGIEYFYKKVDVKEYAAKNRLSCEEAGRAVRYAFFEEVSQKKNGCKIAVAHNKSDSAETCIFNFIRGACVGGLKGIMPVNGKVVRPLIECSRDEIEKYLHLKNVSHVTDFTNFENVYSRNKIRNIIIKDMEKINPSVVNTVFENSKIIAEENDFIEKYVEKTAYFCTERKNGEIFLDTSKLENEHPAVRKRLVMHCAKKLVPDFKSNAKNIAAISDLKHGKKFLMENYGLTIYNNYGILRFKVDFSKSDVKNIGKNGLSGENKGFKYLIFDGNDIKIKKIFDENNLKFDVSFVKFDEISDFKSAVYICVDGINEPIYLRSRKNGDRICVANAGTKKIKDIFIDLKIDAQKRSRIPIVATNDKVLAVCGILGDKNYFAKKESGKILCLKL